MKSQTVSAVVCLIVLLFALGLSAQTHLPARIDPDRSLPDTGGKPLSQPVGSAPAVHPAIGGASVLQLIKFSGSVADAEGVVGVTFSLYADQEGGSPLWLETQNVQLDAEGRFTVLLGATASEGLPLDIFASGNARWLGIQAQGQPELARILFVAVPYALKAAEADRLAGRAASDYLLADQLDDQVRQTVETQVADQLETKSLSGGGDGTLTQVTGSGTTGRLAKFTSTGVDPTVGDSVLFESGLGRIGVGTTSPTGLVDIPSGPAFELYFSGGGGNANIFQNSATLPLLLNTAGGVIGLGRAGSGSIDLEVDKAGVTRLFSGKLYLQRNLTDQAGRRNWAWVTETANVGDISLLVSQANTSDPLVKRMTVLSNGNVGIGTSTPQGLLQVAGQSGGLLIQDNATSPNIIGGFSGNSVSGGISGATIGGGGDQGLGPNQVTGQFGTIGGGAGNTASGTESTVGGGGGNTVSSNDSTVGGGIGNTASGGGATVGGGGLNTASGTDATVGGGVSNIASGLFSTVPGGAGNVAQGIRSFAAGNRAKALNNGAFVWADSTVADVTSTADDQFTIRASGGFRMVVGATPTEVFSIDGNGNVETDGDVKLGPSAGLFAPGGPENLRIVRGRVSSAGAVLDGSGFSAARLSAGHYTVTVDAGFTAESSPVVTPVSNTPLIPVIVGLDAAGSFLVDFYSTGGALTDTEFVFVTAGPR